MKKNFNKIKPFVIYARVPYAYNIDADTEFNIESLSVNDVLRNTASFREYLNKTFAETFNCFKEYRVNALVPHPDILKISYIVSGANFEDLTTLLVEFLKENGCEVYTSYKEIDDEEDGDLDEVTSNEESQGDSTEADSEYSDNG